eukprot:bmy_16493T0
MAVCSKSYGTSLGMGYCTCGILCVPENKVHLAKTDGETLSALKINKVVVRCVQVLAKDWCISLNGFIRNGEYLQCLHFDYLLGGDIINLSLLKKINAGHLDSFCSDEGHCAALLLLHNPELFFNTGRRNAVLDSEEQQSGPPLHQDLFWNKEIG